jgi:N-acetylneuraminate synthase
MQLGKQLIQDGGPIYVIAEAGINHNGSIEDALRLIDVAADAGCQAIKFQKRTPSISTPEHQKNVLRDTPWGEMTYLAYKERIEFGREEYEQISIHSSLRGIDWFASPWDMPSVSFLESMNVFAYKIASASLTDTELLKSIKATGKPIILSTGMSTLEEIDRAVELLGTTNLVLLHATSTYPLSPDEANLRMISVLRDRYSIPVGYSGHETGLQISIAAAALGATVIERHITLDRSMWGTDQSASLEPQGLAKLVRDIRVVERAMGDGVKRVFESEIGPREKLRRVM